MRGPPNLLPFINSCQTRIPGPPRRLASGFLLSHIRVNERGGCICSRPVFVCRPVSVVEASPSGMICQPSHTHCQGSLVADRNPRPAAKDSRPLTVRCQEQRSLTAKYGEIARLNGLYRSQAGNEKCGRNEFLTRPSSKHRETISCARTLRLSGLCRKMARFRSGFTPISYRFWGWMARTTPS